ncbi:unnamed protein product [Urochloa humidicola]
MSWTMTMSVRGSLSSLGRRPFLSRASPRRLEKRRRRGTTMPVFKVIDLDDCVLIVRSTRSSRCSHSIFLPGNIRIGSTFLSQGADQPPFQS